MLRLWPQAVGMDEGDLKILREMCDSGSRGGHERLRWADYLWLDLVDEFTKPKNSTDAYRIDATLSDSRGDDSFAGFWSIREARGFDMPKPGKYSIAGAPACVIELKAAESDLRSKLEKLHKKGGTWSEQVFKTLAHHWQSNLRDANEQIGDSRDLLQCPTARGVVLLVEKEALKLNSAVVAGYVNPTIEGLKNIDAVVYLENKENGEPEIPLFVMRAPNDPAIIKFATHFQCMVYAYRLSWLNSAGEISISSPQPSLVAQISVAAEKRDELRSNWRKAIQSSDFHMKVAFVERGLYRSGLTA